MHLIVIVTEHASPASPALIGGSIGGILILTIIIAVVVFIAVMCCYARRSQATATRVSTWPSTASSGSRSNQLSTQPHPPPPTTAINLQQLQPQSAPRLTFTQLSDPSIRDAPVSAFHSHETFANYSENTNPSAYEPPSYDPGPSFYDVATDDFCQGDMW